MDVIRLPAWLPSEHGAPLRACRVACFSGDRERILESELGAEAEIPALLRKMLGRASRSWSAPPARVEVADPRLAGWLEPILSPHGIPLERIAEISPALRQAQSQILEAATRADPRPSPLSAPGVTLARLAAFARAAGAFQESRIGLLLTGFDRVRVESPEVEPELRELIVEGGGEPGASTPGLLFAGEAVDDGWTVAFEHPWQAPPDDLDLWERYGLPWAGGDRCPVAWYEGEDPERPDGRRLLFFEGLLLALAATSEEDLEAGRWEKSVRVEGRPLRFVLSLPDLLEAEPVPEPEGETPRERALDLLKTARSALGRRRIVLTRSVLEIWPGCAEAWLFLSRSAPGLESSLEILARGVDACRAELEPDSLPFLDLLRNLGDTFAIQGRFEEAAAAYREILELAPQDPVGARYGCASVLLTLGRDAEAEELLREFGYDSSALLAWPRVLLGFRREGDSLETRRLLKRAWEANGLAAARLLGSASAARAARGSGAIPDEVEAGMYALLSCVAWKATPGALDWLRARVATAGGKAAPPAKAKRKKRRR